MAISMKGLRLKPKYEDLIGVAVSDKLYNIKFPNRDATCLRMVLFYHNLMEKGWGKCKFNKKTQVKKYLKKVY